MDWTVVRCADALAAFDQFDAVIDVRSPAEFALDRLPGAINLPVLDDGERARVGTLYQQSPFEARRLGAALVARNIAGHLERALAGCPRTWRPLVYCWRGGGRSAAMTHVLERIGWPARQLDGGYRAWRAMVIASLDGAVAALRWHVLGGATGCGKTRLLHALRDAGAQVLDLEALACHRGSVLGGLPLAPQPGQRAFESALWWTLRGFDPQQIVYVESESRKVGRLRVPDGLVTAMRAAPFNVVTMPLAQRVRLLRQEYAHYESDPAALFGSLQALVPLHGRQRIDAWRALALERSWDAFVECMLVEHYDPAYARSMRDHYLRALDSPALVIGAAEPGAFAEAAAGLRRSTG